MITQELIDRAHAMVKSKGFYDTPPNVGVLLMLIISELGEALEAHRKDRRCRLPLIDEEMDAAGFERHIKDSFEDELADAVIRIADLSGYLGIFPKWPGTVEMEDHFTPGSALFDVTRIIVDGTRYYSPGGDSRNGYIVDPVLLGEAVAMLYALAKAMNIDLDRHIQLKMQYNSTRPRLHGKQY